MVARPRSRRIVSVLRRALPRTKKGIFFSSFSASSASRRGLHVGSTTRLSAQPRAAEASTDRSARPGRAQMRGRGAVVEFGVVAEHREQMLLEPHHQRMDPGVEDHIGAFEAHLRRIAGGEILHMHRRGDHRAGNAEPLGDMALHLRAEHEFGLQFGDFGFDVEIIVGDRAPRRRSASAASRTSRANSRA